MPAGRLSKLLNWLLPLVVLLGLLVPLARAYGAPGYQLGHDRAVPYMRVTAIEDAVKTGQLPPRWFPAFDGGYGSPYPSFYGMLVYDLAAVLDSCCVSLGGSMELAAFLTIALSGLGMFLLGKTLWGTPSGILSAGLYLYAPYHLVDAFVRGAYSELAAFAWFPFVVLSMVRWWKTEEIRWVVAGALSVAGLMLTHNIMPMIFLPALPFLGVALLGRGFLKRWWTLLGWGAMAGLGAMLSAFFWLPILAETPWIQTDYFLQVTYRDEFVAFGELLATSLNHGLTSEAGVPLLVSACCGLLATSISDHRGSTRRLMTFAVLTTLGYVLIMNHRSAVLWDAFRPLQLVQLPWRFLAPATFFLSLMAGALPAALPSRLWQWGLATAIPLLAIQVHAPLIRVESAISAEDLARVETCEEVWGTQDYRPRWSSAAFWRGTDPPQGSSASPVLPPCPAGPRLISPGASVIQAVSWEGPRIALTYDSEQQGDLEIPQFYYPSWSVRVDGEVVESEPAPRTGLLRIEAPAGLHQVEARIQTTVAQSFGEGLTILGLLAVLVVAARRGLAPYISVFRTRAGIPDVQAIDVARE